MEFKLIIFPSDFLPMKCDACQEIFCKDHITYATHKCTSAYKKVLKTVCVCLILWWFTFGNPKRRSCIFNTQKRNIVYCISVFTRFLLIGTLCFEHFLFSLLCRMSRCQCVLCATHPFLLKEGRCLILKLVNILIEIASQTQHKGKERLRV